MYYLIIAIKIIIGLGIINVWLFRGSKATPWRGGDATSLKTEFMAYGLSETHMYIVGFFKVSLALLLLASIHYTSLTIYAALGIALFMLGAILMHLKISDPITKSLPALSLMLLSLTLVMFEIFSVG